MMSYTSSDIATSFLSAIPGKKIKWFAVIVSVFMIFGAVTIAFNSSSGGNAGNANTSIVSMANTFGGSIKEVMGGGTNYTFQVAYGNPLNSISYEYGDLSSGSSSTSGFSGGVYTDLPNGNATLSHNYVSGGNFIFASNGSYSNGGQSPTFLAPINTVTPAANQFQSAGFLFANDTYTTAIQTNFTPTNIFTNSGTISLELAYYTEPSTYSYQIYSQSVTIYHNGKSSVYNFNYSYNSMNLIYEPPQSVLINLSASSYSGYSVAKIVTNTGYVSNTTTGLIVSKNATSATTYYDFVAMSPSTVVMLPSYLKGQFSGTFTNAELETGGFRTLDPQLAYDTVSNEILANTYQQLTIYNGSSVSGYSPYLAAYLPTSGHGVNAHYHNYTATFNSATAGYGTTHTYKITVAPGTNYTFTINKNATFQNGTPVTAYDVYYSLVRDLLFTGSPGTFNPGWIIAQYMLPTIVSATFYNITQNMTYSNSANTVTIHFQVPMTEDLVYQLFYAQGTYITSASWLIQHGSGITFSASGFANYIEEGSPADWNTYIQTHVDANGPYRLYSVSQNSEVVMEANTHFVSPNKWVLAPSYKFVIIEYIEAPTTTYLLLKSGAAQAAGIPDYSWNEVQSLQASNQVNVAEGSTLVLTWYNFNANVNHSIASKSTPGINMPFDMFTSLHARRAFNFAYNHNQYLNYDIGNALFSSPVQFGSNYAGMMPVGMIGGVPFSQLNSTSWGQQAGIGFNMNLAHKNWNIFVKNWNANANIIADKMTLTNVSGVWEFNGSALYIPIYIFSADPADFNGASSWARNLAIITGDPTANFPVIPATIQTLIDNQFQGQNPMPIYELSWAPDYPYPTDYLWPMANPLNGSTYPGPNDFTPYWFGQSASNPYHNATEAAIMNQMLADYANGTQQVNTSTALYWFHQENNLLINMSYYNYIEQSNAFVILSSSVNFTNIREYQMGTVWLGSYYLYNDLTPIQTSSYAQTPTYNVTFTESGLPSGTTWYANLSNGKDSGPITGTSYTFSLTNGTYSYSISMAGKTYESPSGSFRVNGSSVSISAPFLKVYPVTFTETGLPSGTPWYVNLSNGVDSGPITGSSYSFSLTNGTYSFTIGKVSGYSASPPSGSISVNGSKTVTQVTFTATPPPISGNMLYEIVGIIAAVVLIGTFVSFMRRRKL